MANIQKIHLYSNIDSYHNDSENIGTNDLAFIPSTSVSAEYINSGFNPVNVDSLVRNGTLLAGTALKDGDNYPYRSGTAVTTLNTATNSYVAKAITLSQDYHNFKYLVFVLVHTGTDYTGARSLIIHPVRVAEIVNTENVYNEYITSSANAYNGKASMYNLISQWSDTACGVSFFQGGLNITEAQSNGTTVIYTRVKYCRILAIYGIDDLEMV